jgi:glycosyltransferase involved in cell wall biosynthesis
MNSFALSTLVRKKSSVLYNILDTHKLLERVNVDKNTYDFDIVFLGRLSSPKDPLRLVEVFSRVAKNPEIKMCIIGDGPMRQEVEEELHNRYLDKQVTLLGFLSNPYKVLKSAKVMVMTSKNEGTPMCALEAMALGVPIVSTPVDGLLDIIKNDVNGFLCVSDDEIAKKLEMIVMNKELHERLYENQLKLSKDWNDTSAYKRKLLEEYMLASRR